MPVRVRNMDVGGRTVELSEFEIVFSRGAVARQKHLLPS